MRPYELLQLEQKAKNGSGDSHFQLAQHFLATNNLPKSANHMYAAASVGVDAAKKQFQQSGTLYKKAVTVLNSQTRYYMSNDSNANLAYIFGMAYKTDESGCQNSQIAINFFAIAVQINRHHFKAHNELAKAHYYGKLGVQKNPKRAFERLKPLVGAHQPKGNAETFYLLGLMYKNGEGTDKSLNEAETYLNKSMALGYVDAAFELGKLQHTKYNDAKAQKHYNKSSLANLAIETFLKCGKKAEAYNYIGLIAYNEDKINTAEKYFKLAADAKLPIGLSNLARIYDFGKCGEQKKQQAFSLFEKAANLGHLESMFKIACMLLESKSSSSDLLTAFKWYKRAATAGHKQSQEKLNSDETFERLNRWLKPLNQNFDKLMLYSNLEKALGYQFTDPTHLLNALDRRVQLDHEAPFQCYEFLGDSVLSSSIANVLFIQKPKGWVVGDMHLAKQHLVRNDTVLPKIARTLKIANLIQRSETEANHVITNKMLADAVEALIGAISQDSSHAKAADVIEHLWDADIKKTLTTKPMPASQAGAQVIAPPPVKKHTRATSAGSIGFFTGLTSLTSADLEAKVAARPEFVTMQNQGKKGLTPLMHKLKQLSAMSNPKKVGNVLNCIDVLFKHGATLQDTAANGRTAEEMLKAMPGHAAEKEKIRSFAAGK